jgi:predicted nucleic acid-binding protein
LIVVDTSVWIDFLRGRSTSQAARLEALIADGIVLAVTGVIRMELLRGASAPIVEELRASLDEHPVLPTEQADFDLAADLYRRGRSAGLAVRSSIDCLIAAPCIRTGTPLLHADADFDRVASISDLRVVAA